MTEHENIEELVFGGVYQEKLICECKNVKTLPIKNMDEIIHLQVTGRNIQDSLEAYISSEKVKSKCSDCQSPDKMKTSDIVFAPATLIFHLLRFRYDENGDETVKLDYPMSSPLVLTLPNGPTYVLNSVINHIGESSNSGHYNIVVFDKHRNNFILIDDCEIVDDVNIEDTAKTSYVATYTRM